MTSLYVLALGLAAAVSLPTVASVDPPTSYVGNNGSPANRFPLQHCEGDCDVDSDCDRGLRCYQRDEFWLTPGCTGSDGSRTDYCVYEDAPDLPGIPVTKPPTSMPTGDSTKAPTSSPTEAPTTSPTAFPTSAPTLVPTLIPTSMPTTEPTSGPSRGPTSAPTATASSGPTTAPTTSQAPTPMTMAPTGTPEIVSYGSDPEDEFRPLQLCTGDCDLDTDCADGLMCFQRGPNDAVPGCAGGEQYAEPTDFCVVGDTEPPTMGPKDLNLVSDTAATSLGHCQGPCDSDEQCGEGLYCYLRSEGDEIPSCSGVATGDSNYCVDKTNAYTPGHLTVNKIGLILSEGLDVRIVATYTWPVEYSDGTQSATTFHGRPDAGATFPDTRPGNEGGWVYVSNSEMLTDGDGGVGAITFDKDGNTLDYRMILEGTTWNCGGGRTPWNTWVSCEESDNGEVYQVDPFGVRPPEKVNLDSRTGKFESFAADNRDPVNPVFFITEDRDNGALIRLIPLNQNNNENDPWSTLHGNMWLSFLLLSDDGTFRWTSNHDEARANAKEFYPHSEGIDFYGSSLYFVCKGIRTLFTLDMVAGTWEQSSTTSGLFQGQPDQVQRIIGDSRDMLYFTEEGGELAGIHARDSEGNFYTVMEGTAGEDETTGLAMSPDGKFMYVAFQDDGVLYSIWRKDGMPFDGHPLDVKYHSTTTR